MHKILITGGLGFIGSNIIYNLLKKNKNIEVHVVDNLSNSHIKTLYYLRKFSKNFLHFYQANINEKSVLDRIFQANKIDAVIHLAALKSVSESESKKGLYYWNNIRGSKILLKSMLENNVNNLIFSSSATVYGIPRILPIKEIHRTKPINFYGFTKLEIEKEIISLTEKNNKFKSIILRYFNPVGSNDDNSLGDNPRQPPANVMPLILKAISNNKNFNIFGSDYITHDGSGVRDYIHISDLADAHIESLSYFSNIKNYEIFNVGTGVGFSVLELLKTFNRTNNTQLKYVFCDRRKGDVDEVFASSKKIQTCTNWRPTKNIKDMCLSSYKFYLKNKNLI